MTATPFASTTVLGITLLRASLGAMWIAHALRKVFAFTLPGTAQSFSSVGLPGVMAWPVFLLELPGGFALVLGVFARQVALALVPAMAVATWVHLTNGWPHTSPGGGWEYPAFLIMASVALRLIGDGTAAIRRSRRFVPTTA